MINSMLVPNPKEKSRKKYPNKIITLKSLSTTRAWQATSTPPKSSSTSTADMLTTKVILNASLRKSTYYTITLNMTRPVTVHL